ncbi:MAG: hypothetical protein ACXWDI_08165 [Nocardioides sp.]
MALKVVVVAAGFSELRWAASVVLVEEATGDCLGCKEDEDEQDEPAEG